MASAEHDDDRCRGAFCYRVWLTNFWAPYFSDADVDGPMAEQAAFVAVRQTGPRAAGYGSRAGDEYEGGGGADEGGDEYEGGGGADEGGDGYEGGGGGGSE